MTRALAIGLGELARLRAGHLRRDGQDADAAILEAHADEVDAALDEGEDDDLDGGMTLELRRVIA